MINESTVSGPLYRPVQAWLVYQLQSTEQEATPHTTFGGSSFRDAPEYYLEEHEVYPDQQGTFQLSAGAPLSEERVAQVAHAVRSEAHPGRAFQGLIPFRAPVHLLRTRSAGLEGGGIGAGRCSSSSQDFLTAR